MPKIQERVGGKYTFIMKNKIKLFLFALCMVFSPSLFSQLRMMKAKNCDAKFNTNMPFTWSGPIKNGYCHGKGTIQWFDKKGNKSTKMIGTIKKGKNEGYCTFYSKKGKKTFEGMYVNDMRNGHGKIYYSNGTSEEGEWSDDTLVSVDTDGISAAVVDTIGATYTANSSGLFDDEMKKTLQESLDVFCYNNYSDCFSGRNYIEYSLRIDKVEKVEEGIWKAEGTHSYKGAYGTLYSDMEFSAIIYLTQQKIVFNKRVKADYFHSSDYWEECSKYY